MSHLNRHALFAAKVEAAAGTYVSPTLAANGIRLIGASDPEEFFLSPNARDDHQTGSVIVATGDAPAGRGLRVRLMWAPIGADEAYAYTSEDVNVLPEEHALLRAAGRSLSVDAGVATYTRADIPSTTISALIRISGKEYRMRGAVFESLVTRCTVNGFPVREGTLVGVLEASSEQALGTATLDEVAHPLWNGDGALLIGAYKPRAQTVEIDEGLAAEPNTNANAADGLDFYQIVRSRNALTVSARIPVLTEWSPKAVAAAGTVFGVTVAFGIGQGTLKRVKYVAGAAKYAADPAPQDVPNGEQRNYSAVIVAGPHETDPGNWVYD